MTIKLLLLILLILLSIPFLKAQDIDPSGWTLTFVDEFDSLSVSNYGPVGDGLGETIWIAHTPYYGDFGIPFANPNAPWTDFPFITEEGILRIEARMTGSDPCNTWENWHGGLLCSSDPDRQGFSQKLGYFEVRAKMPQGPGTWPAFWLNSWEGYEIDIVEHYGHQPDEYHVVLHDWVNDWHNGMGHGYQACDSAWDYRSCLTEDFHTYGALVATDTIRFYLDRKEIWKYPTTTGFRDANYYVLVNLSMGSGWNTCETPNPSYMYVDYVKVWQYIAPACTLTSPINGTTIEKGMNITITADAIAGIGSSVSRVDFYQNETLIASDDTYPYTHTLSNAETGFHKFTAVAYNEEGYGNSSNTNQVQVYEGDVFDVAWMKTVYASSAEGVGLEAENAVDGSLYTRWSSAFSDPQWIYVDFGESYTINQVKIYWEGAYAQAYQIQISDNASEWNTIYSTGNSNGGLDDISLSGTGRYLRIYGTQRNTTYGYSLYELEVYKGNNISALESLMQADELVVYPNPAKDVLYIEMQNHNEQDVSLEMYDAMGQKVPVLLKNENSTLSFPLNSIPNGVYFIQLRGTEKKNLKKKILINR